MYYELQFSFEAFLLFQFLSAAFKANFLVLGTYVFILEYEASMPIEAYVYKNKGCGKLV